jgi:hypothetical protein
MEADPFKDLDELRMGKLLNKFRIKPSTWDALKRAYVNYVPDFDSMIINSINDKEFTKIVDFFHFEKTSIKDMKNEYNRWLKRHWETFAGEDAPSIYNNIITIGNQYFQYSGIQNPFINWIPLYGRF